jgi:large subunit ribosomal protein L13
MKTETFRALQGRIPERIIEKAVRGMLPKNRLGRELFTQLKVYAGSEHPHAAQNPADVTAEVKERCYSSSMVQ